MWWRYLGSRSTRFAKTKWPIPLAGAACKAHPRRRCRRAGLEHGVDALEVRKGCRRRDRLINGEVDRAPGDTEGLHRRYSSLGVGDAGGAASLSVGGANLKDEDDNNASCDVLLQLGQRDGLGARAGQIADDHHNARCLESGDYGRAVEKSTAMAMDAPFRRACRRPRGRLRGPCDRTQHHSPMVNNRRCNGIRLWSMTR